MLRELPSCSTCQHWRGPAEADQPGECRRHPPATIIQQAPGLTPAARRFDIQSYWPPVVGSSWCGEFKARESSGAH